MVKGSGVQQQSIDLAGFWSAVASFALWGVLPLYWKQLDHIPAFEILMHRVWWCLFFVGIYTILIKRFSRLREIFSSWKKGLFVALKAAVLGTNWFIFVWAVNSGRVVESSLGYYINPLLSVLLAMLFLHERLKKIQYAAFLLAFAGVLIMTFSYGQVPWVSLLLAFSFGLYGLLKKIVPVDAEVGLFSETLFIGPVALILIIIGAGTGTGFFLAGDMRTTLLLVAGGFVTALPLLFFSHAVKKIPLTVVGFIQYIAPTGMLLLGVFVFGEPFDFVKLVCFILIWIALTLFTIGQFRNSA